MWRSINFLLIWIGLIGSVFTILLGFQSWYPQAHPDGRVAIIALSCFVAISTTCTAWQEYRYSRKARYAEAFPYLRQIFYETSTHDAARIAALAEIENICRLIVNRLAAALSLVSGTKCSVCIKVMVISDVDGGGELRPKVATLCRDDTSLERERGTSPIEYWLEELENPAAVEHWVKENTDFQRIYERAGTPQRVFFSNYLPGEKNYQNTSFKIYGNPNKYWRSFRWPLPYKSTIVAPISSANILRRQVELAGYLCVDSKSRYAFSQRYDIDMMTAVADSLFNLVHRYCKLASDIQEREDEDGGD